MNASVVISVWFDSLFVSARSQSWCPSRLSSGGGLWCRYQGHGWGRLCGCPPANHCLYPQTEDTSSKADDQWGSSCSARLWFQPQCILPVHGKNKVYCPPSPFALYLFLFFLLSIYFIPHLALIFLLWSLHLSLSTPSTSLPSCLYLFLSLYLIVLLNVNNSSHCFFNIELFALFFCFLLPCFFVLFAPFHSWWSLHSSYICTSMKKNQGSIDLSSVIDYKLYYVS